MRRKREIHDLLRNPYVRALVLTGSVLMALWRVSETGWGQRVIVERGGVGRPFSEDHYFELTLPGARYFEVDGYAGPFWSLEVRNSLLVTMLSFGAVGLLVMRTGSIWRVRRRPTGHCPACGYDLRTSANRCPECGRVCDVPGG